MKGCEQPREIFLTPVHFPSLWVSLICPAELHFLFVSFFAPLLAIFFYLVELILA